MNPTELAQLLFVVGPTASGKSAVAIEICERLCQRFGQAEILNCDSVQFFKGVEIGAAKPSAPELARAVHHLISHVELGGEYTAGGFRRDALRVIEGGSARAVQKFLAVGGSGFYVQALEKGMYEVPEVPETIRKALETEILQIGPRALHAELHSRDPEAGAKIDPNDKYRILRALELLRISPKGTTLASMRARFEAAQPAPPFTVAKLGLSVSRERLRERVIERTRGMLAAGLIDEVQNLRAQGLAGWAPLRSVGYKETQLFLDGKLTRAELEPLIVTSTMQLGKRQMTWFKRDAEIRWFDAEKELSLAFEFALEALAT